MRAIVQTGYGGPDVLELREIDRPGVGDDDVLVRVRAAALHAGDYFGMRGAPYMVRMAIGWPKPKKSYVPGFDLAGRVEEVGKNVTRFRPGDEVFGARTGTCAEYVCAAQEELAPAPANIKLEQAAAVPTSGFTALRGIRDAGKVQPGHKVLINGAAGGVGTFAVQIAKFFGAEVTGVCSTRNVGMVRSIGADHVVDYTQEDFTRGERRYDLILDNVASRSLSDLRRALSPTGIIVPNSGHGGVSYVAKAFLLSLFMRQHGSMFLAVPDSEGLGVLKDLIEARKVTPVIDRTYPLAETPEAFAYLEKVHARGKVLILVPE